MRTVIVLNGPINAGKTTIGRALAAAMADVVFVDGDDNGAPEDATLDAFIAASLARLCREIADNPAHVLVFAYPMRDEDHALLTKAADAHARRVVTVTLAPPIASVLADRGERRLDAWERDRIVEMYAEGYHDRAFSDIVVTGTPGITETVAIIRAGLAGLD